MRFNEPQIIEFAAVKGEDDHEGRLTYKSSSRSIYEKNAYKEKWFKLKGNLLFYYNLNSEGVIEKNEPNGVFVLENITVEKEVVEKEKNLYGFSITWKDDLYKKHRFYAPSENVMLVWISKFVKASFENLRAELLVLRLQIQRKSGKDPLEHLGTPLPVRSIRGVFVSPSKATSSFRSHLGITPSSSETRLAAPVNNNDEIRFTDLATAKSAPNTPSIVTKFDSVSVPLPPPRTNRDRRKLSGKEMKYSLKNKVASDASFKSHIVPTESKNSGSFKSHIKLSEEELQEFLS